MDMPPLLPTVDYMKRMSLNFRKDKESELTWSLSAIVYHYVILWLLW